MRPYLTARLEVENVSMSLALAYSNLQRRCFPDIVKVAGRFAADLPALCRRRRPETAERDLNAGPADNSPLRAVCPRPPIEEGWVDPLDHLRVRGFTNAVEMCVELEVPSRIIRLKHQDRCASTSLRTHQDITRTDHYHLNDRVQVFCSHGNLTGINHDSP